MKTVVLKFFLVYLLAGMALADRALGEDVDLSLYGDIGGFGVGSDFTYRAGLGVDWHVSKSVDLMAGASILGFDYSTGSGTQRLRFENTMVGPYLGARFKL